MKQLIIAGIAVGLFAMPALAQNPAYPTPDNNLTRSDDVDPSEAPYLNEEQGRPSSDDYSLAPSEKGVVVEFGATGSSSGESGSDLPPPADYYPPAR